jgi:hypothetical protein
MSLELATYGKEEMQDTAAVVPPSTDPNKAIEKLDVSVSQNNNESGSTSSTTVGLLSGDTRDLNLQLTLGTGLILLGALHYLLLHGNSICFHKILRCIAAKYAERDAYNFCVNCSLWFEHLCSTMKSRTFTLASV